MALIAISDFTGKYLTAKDSYNTTVLQSYIDSVVPIALAKLLGADLSTTFMANLDGSGVPTDPLLLDIFNPLMFNDYCGNLMVSNGIKQYALGLVFWEYVTNQRVQPSITAGASSANVEVGSAQSSSSEIYQRYNESIDYGIAIQQYILEHISDYPTFKGSQLLYNYSL